MSKLDWIKELVEGERKMEETGVIDFSAGFDPQKNLNVETQKFLESLKQDFVDFATAFNQLKGMSLGGIKIYGIAGTTSDFMLFRNGYKLIFATKAPGQISVRFQFQGAGFIPGEKAAGQSAENLANEDLIEARWGAFGQLIWTYKELEAKPEFVIRYYLSRFIRESAK